MVRCSCSLGKFARLISTIPRKSSRVKRFSSKTCSTIIWSLGFTLKMNSSFHLGFKVYDEWTTHVSDTIQMMNSLFVNIRWYTFFFVLVKHESMLTSELILFRSIRQYGSLAPKMSCECKWGGHHWNEYIHMEEYGAALFSSVYSPFSPTNSPIKFWSWA